jgi:hypothetical protein
VFCPEFYSFGKRPVDDKMVRGEEDRKLERLIVEVEKNPGLYDKELQLYKDPTKKEDIWKAL